VSHATPLLCRVALSIFILLHLIAMLCWALPLNSLLVQVLKEQVAPYMLWSGLFQAWDMFAPNPRMANVSVEAEVTFSDGQQRIWPFPRMEQLGLVDRYCKERYRKWANDHLRMDANAGLWPDAARYIARLHTQPGNPPVTVRLVRSWADIPPPTDSTAPLPAHTNRFVFFTYGVEPDDLL